MNSPISDILDPATAEIIPPPAELRCENGALDDAPLNAGQLGTDLDASLRFATAHADTLRYCPGIGWLFWDKRHWVVDGDGRAIELSKQSARRWTKQWASHVGDDRDRMMKLALTLESGPHVKNVVDLAKVDRRLVVPASALDADPWSLNVFNGTLDLRTGKLRPHSRTDFFTKLAPVEYVPETKGAMLTRYLDVVEKHGPGLSAFLARCFGAALTGDAETETLFLLQGDGGSGKTTLTEAFAAMLGDYAVKLPFESFCQSRHGRSPGAASPDLIPLRGSRFAYASEGDATARLDAGKVKELTGNEPITARGLYEKPITFPQTWKLWLVSNFDPKTDSEDSGIWRRMLKVPFAVIPEAERDPAVKRALVSNSAARTALLSWAMAGCMDWQRRGGGRVGLAPPEAVSAATGAYRVKQDTLAEWWEDMLLHAIMYPSGFTASKALRDHYESWCEDNGASPVFAARFKTYLEGKGLVPGRTSGARGWNGISLGK